MKADMMNRVMEARKYQKKAIMALFPESMSGHIEVIEKELSAMFMECAVEMASQYMKQNSTYETEDEFKQKAVLCEETKNQSMSKKSKIRKVSIDN